MKKRMLFLSFLFLSLSVWAVEPTHLRVHRTDGEVLNAQLDKQLVLDFLEENVAYYMALKQADSADVQIALVEIQKMTFGEAIGEGLPDPEPNPEDSVPDLPEVSDEPNTMYVYHTDGKQFSAALDKQVVLRFLEETLQVKLLQQAPTSWMLTDVQKITFGIEETPDVPTAVETLSQSVSNQDDVRKVLENGQLIIIRNGVRYNIFGMRL